VAGSVRALWVVVLLIHWDRRIGRSEVGDLEGFRRWRWVFYWFS
jgi:hypothetical protein